MIRQMKDWTLAHREAGLLLFWLLFLPVFRMLEYIVLPQHPIASGFDSLIPFCIWFAIPYFSWYPALALFQGYYLVTDRRQFQNLCFLMFSGMTIAIIVYIVYPISIDVRVPLLQEGALYDLVRGLQSMDSPRNVCPSIHVSSSIAIAMVFANDPKQKRWIKAAVWIWMLLISASTVFIKQHSILDVFWGAALTGALSWITYRWDWRGALQRTPVGRVLG